MNRIVETPDGFDCIVNELQFGTWRSRAEAKAGMATEVQRAADRDQAESDRLIEQTNAEVRRHHEWRMQQ